MTKGPRRTKARPGVQSLEVRALLSGTAAIWIGQDNQDYTGPYYGLKPDGTQDIDIRLENLPAGRSLVSADILGLGGGEWRYHGPYGPWSAEYVASPGSNSGDLYFEPSQVETGRPFNVKLTFDNGSTADLWLSGGPADPNLRVNAESVRATWIGQDGSDFAGPGASVGPDGIQDVHLALSRLPVSSDIQSVKVTSSSGETWEYGLNPDGLTSAELVRNASDPSKADLYLDPDQDLAGQTLSVVVTYSSGKTDSTSLVAQSVNPGLLAAPAPGPPPMVSEVSASWIGQDGQASEGAGWARFSVSGLPSGVSVEGATLSGPDHNSWVYKAPGNNSYYADLYAGQLGFHASGSNQATLAFPPDRNEAGTTLVLRLSFSDGSMAVVPVKAGPTDIGLLSAQPSPAWVVAKPGDDLNALARKYGRIDLSPGEYDLSAPLVLDNPVTIEAPSGGATLVFTQPSGSSPWTSAIKVHSGNTALSGFSVKFSGPVVWNWDVNYGPAVVGSTDNLDPPGHNDPKTNIKLINLNIQAPPAGTSGEQAPEVIRLTTARGGLVRGCTLQGGTTEFLYGPWTIEDNTYLGTMPGTWAWEVFAGHSTHDLVIRNNSVSPAPDAGKTWRFLVLTGSDDGAFIEGNHVSGIGPKDTDTDSKNAAEIILTEAYSLSFEGKPLRLSDDGRILQIPTPQGAAPSSGDVVAILDGPHAGTWVRVAQAVSPTTLLLESPLPEGSYDVSVASGFVNQTYQGNTIDARGSSVAADLDLVGNHYGTKVLDNTFLGGGDGLLVQSYPTESPSIWGWSHDPVLGLVVSGNTITDSLRAMTLRVNHGPDIKTDQGRTYLTASVMGNTVAWTNSFAQGHVGNPALGIVLGQKPSLDPDELRVSLSDNRADAPPVSGGGPTVQTVSANVNGQPVSNAVVALPQILPDAPSGLRLVHDSGASASDGLTNDAHLSVGPASRAASYAYRTGPSGTYRPVSDPKSFVPEGLVQGANTVYVHALDAYGRAGPDTALTFTLDMVPPGPVQNLATSGTSVSLTLPEPGDTLRYRVGSGPWVSAGPVSNFNLPDLPQTKNVVQVEAADPAGNVGPVSSAVINNEPIRVSGRWVGQDGHDFVGPYPVASPDGTQDVHLVLSNLPLDRSIAFIDIQGLGGSQWQYGGNWGPWKIALFRSPGSASADLYIQPDRVETGRPFQITVWFTDGFRSTFWISGGKAVPNPPMAANAGPKPTPSVSAERLNSPAIGPRAPARVQTAAPAPLGRLARRLAFREALRARLQARHALDPVDHSAVFQRLLARRQQRLAAWSASRRAGGVSPLSGKFYRPV